MFPFSASSLNESDLKPHSYFDRKWTFWTHLPPTVLNILHSKTKQTVSHTCLVVSLQADLLLWRGAHSRCVSGSVTLRHLMALFSNLKLCRDCFSNHTGSGDIGITSRAQRFTARNTDEWRRRWNNFRFSLKRLLLNDLQRDGTASVPLPHSHS